MDTNTTQGYGMAGRGDSGCAGNCQEGRIPARRLLNRALSAHQTEMRWVWRGTSGGRSILNRGCRWERGVSREQSRSRLGNLFI